jgi:hypothetical protein
LNRSIEIGFIAVWQHFPPQAGRIDAGGAARCAARLGEQTTNVVRSASVALRTCTVSFNGPSGIRHSVDVTAESVYEAAALGVSALRQSGWADVLALGTELEVQVREPPTCHRLTIQQIHRWCDGIAASPDETLKKRRLKQLLT